MRGLNSLGPLALRIAGVALLILLLWNPAVTRRPPGGGAPVVLLDASLSMGARPGLWARALDTARTLARGGVILRFGGDVAAFDTTAPRDGTSRLGPALAAAAARGGPIAIVTDGAIDDLDALPADLIARARVVVLGQDAGPDAFVSSVEGPHQVSPEDTVTLRVTYGTAGTRGTGNGKRGAQVSVRLGGRVVTSREVTLPDSGTVNADVTFPVSRFPAGWSSLSVGVQWPGDFEPRDDARVFLLHVTSEPAAVVIGAPPDWDATFLARTLGDVARVPVKYYAQITAGKWNEGVTLASVTAEQVRRAIAGARLVVEVGDPARWTPASAPALLTWNSTGGATADWYLTPSAGSPVTGALASVPWDSLPPVLAALPAIPESGSVPVLDARVARRGSARPVVLVRETPAGRRATVNVAGLYRWDFRGGASQQAYRALVAGLVDWLLAGGTASADWAHPDSLVVPNGVPVVWRWSGPGAPRNLPVTLAGGGASRVDTLHFGVDGRGELRLSPGVYSYSLADGHGRGMVAVDQYSAEWHGVPALAAQPGRGVADRVVLDWRERWWLFALAIAAFAAEWFWRRRLGLP